MPELPDGWARDGTFSYVRQAAADAGHPMLPWPALDIALDALGSARDGESSKETNRG